MKTAITDLLQSRKVLLAIADALFSTVAIMLTLFFAPDVVDKILTVIGLWQPVVLLVIGSMTAQNVAGIQAQATVTAAKVTAAAVEPVEKQLPS
jgi:hypothetical protein